MLHLPGRAERPGQQPTVPWKCRLVACLRCCWRQWRGEDGSKQRERERRREDEVEEESQRADVAAMVTGITHVRRDKLRNHKFICLIDASLSYGSNSGGRMRAFRAVRCSPWPSADARLCLIDASPPEQRLVGAPDSTRFPFNHSDFTKNPQIRADVPSVWLERRLTHTHTRLHVWLMCISPSERPMRVSTVCGTVTSPCWEALPSPPHFTQSYMNLFCVRVNDLLYCYLLNGVILWEYNYVFDLPCLLLPRSHISLCPSVTLTLMSLCEEHRSGCEKTSAVIVQLLYWYCRLRISMYDFAKITVTNTTLIMSLVFQKY